MCYNKGKTYSIELKDRVLAPWGPSSISAVAELVIFRAGVYIVPSFQFYSSPGVYLFTSNLANRKHKNRASVSKTKYTNKK